MRFVVYGAGAVGGVIGGRLFEHGHEVVLIARGEHARALRQGGLRVDSPDGSVTLAVPTVEHPSEIDLGPDDVVVLSMKSQDTPDALDALVTAAPGPSQPAVVCAQNGVANERAALRQFADVYGMCVMCPTSHLEPGIVQANSSPVSGILDIGRYPDGVDARGAAIAAALGASTFVSEPRPDIMRWKYAKLLMNLANVVQAAFSPSESARELGHRAREEGRACFGAAGIDFASGDEDRARRADLLQVRPVGEQTRGGGSTWQSLARGTGRLETDHLNGEIVLLGRLHGVATPVNEALQGLARRLVAEGAEPGAADAAPFLATLPPVVSAPTGSRADS